MPVDVDLHELACEWRNGDHERAVPIDHRRESTGLVGGQTEYTQADFAEYFDVDSRRQRDVRRRRLEQPRSDVAAMIETDHDDGGNFDGCGLPVDLGGHCEIRDPERVENLAEPIGITCDTYDA